MVAAPRGGSDPPTPDHDENDPGIDRHDAGIADPDDPAPDDSGLIDEVTDDTPSDEIDTEEELVAYGDSPGAGILGVIDDLPEPNEPG